MPLVRGTRYTTLARGAAVASWTPLSLAAALKLWSSADYGTYSDAGSTPSVADGVVQQWNDRSGNGYHFTGAGGARPLLKTNIQNSLPAVRWDSVDDVMASTLTKTLVGSSMWVASVFLPGSTNAGREWYGIRDSGTSHQWLCGATTGPKIRSSGYDGSEHPAVALANFSANTAYCVVNIFNASTIELYINGTQQQSVAAGTPTLGSSLPFKIGGHFHPVGADLCEIIVASGVPSASDISSATSYLRTKWGV